MADVATLRKYALSLDAVTEQAHFHRTSFRIGKKIFATLDETENVLMLRLSDIDQSAFCAWNNELIFPVPGFWGKQGATNFRYKKIPAGMIKDAMLTAYKLIATKKQ